MCLLSILEDAFLSITGLVLPHNRYILFARNESLLIQFSELATILKQKTSFLHSELLQISGVPIIIIKLIMNY